MSVDVVPIFTDIGFDEETTMIQESWKWLSTADIRIAEGDTEYDELAITTLLFLIVHNWTYN